MIVDSHAHIFPYLGGANGFTSVAEHMQHLQKDMCLTSQPLRRAADNAIAEGEALWDGVNPGLNGLYDIDFRVGRFGRLSGHVTVSTTTSSSRPRASSAWRRRLS